MVWLEVLAISAVNRLVPLGEGNVESGSIGADDFKKEIGQGIGGKILKDRLLQVT